MGNKEVIDSLTIGGKEIEVKKLYLKQQSLKFYPDNPRIYSIVHSEGGDLTQDDIENKLCKLDHVKKLFQSIKANNGLLEPLIVRDGDFLVLEGNSRLAAYRMLAKQDAIKWGMVVCYLLPSDISDDLIFKLLGQYHIIGKTDWSPYEQAGYLYRRKKEYSISCEEMAKEMGLSVKGIENLINIFDFMQEHNDIDPQRWSFYVEYLKSRHIKAYRDTILDFDNIIVNKIKTGEIPKAIDIRTKLDPITRVKGQKGASIVNKLLTNQLSFQECFEEVENSGATNNLYQKLTSFRVKIADPDTKQSIKKMKGEQKNKCKYELKKIQEALDIILKELGG